MLTCFCLTKKLVTFFRQLTIIASFLHQMLLMCKVFINHVLKRQICGAFFFFHIGFNLCYNCNSLLNFRKQSYLWLQGDIYRLRKTQNSLKKSSSNKSKDEKIHRSSLAIPRERLQKNTEKSLGVNYLSVRNSLDDLDDPSPAKDFTEVILLFFLFFSTNNTLTLNCTIFTFFYINRRSIV